MRRQLTTYCILYKMSDKWAFIIWFLSILTAFPHPFDQACQFYMMCLKLQLYTKGLTWSKGETPQKLFFAETVFNPYFFNWYLSNLQIIRELNQLPVPRKNIIFFKSFIWPFYGQSFIKTAQGPLSHKQSGSPSDLDGLFQSNSTWDVS